MKTFLKRFFTFLTHSLRVTRAPPPIVGTVKENSGRYELQCFRDDHPGTTAIVMGFRACHQKCFTSAYWIVWMERTSKNHWSFHWCFLSPSEADSNSWERFSGFPLKEVRRYSCEMWFPYTQRRAVSLLMDGHGGRIWTTRSSWFFLVFLSIILFLAWYTHPQHQIQ